LISTGYDSRKNFQLGLNKNVVKPTLNSSHQLFSILLTSN
jgi:hypothetical protein